MAETDSSNWPQADLADEEAWGSQTPPCPCDNAEEIKTTQKVEVGDFFLLYMRRVDHAAAGDATSGYFFPPKRHGPEAGI
jgi:hypothetical protein